MDKIEEESKKSSYKSSSKQNSSSEGSGNTKKDKSNSCIKSEEVEEYSKQSKSSSYIHDQPADPSQNATSVRRSESSKAENGKDLVFILMLLWGCF